MITFDQPYHHTWNIWVFLWAFHVTHTRRAHQFTVATQHILKHRDYDYNCKVYLNDNDKNWLHFEVWGHQRGEESPQFQYCSVMLEWELLLNTYVRFQTIILHYILNTLTELARWYYAMNHIHYAKWIPVHLKGMTELFGRHPEVLII
jgi:hypothetical protein